MHKPPYGTLTAIDLNRGEQLWQVPLGDEPSIRNHPLLRGVTLPPLLGVRGAPGPIVTASGLVVRDGGGAGAVCDRRARWPDAVAARLRPRGVLGADDVRDAGWAAVRGCRDRGWGECGARSLFDGTLGIATCSRISIRLRSRPVRPKAEKPMTRISRIFADSLPVIHGTSHNEPGLRMNTLGTPCLPEGVQNQRQSIGVSHAELSRRMERICENPRNWRSLASRLLLDGLRCHGPPVTVSTNPLTAANQPFTPHGTGIDCRTDR